MLLFLALTNNEISQLYFYSEVLEEAKWSKGDSTRPARAHKITVMVTISEESKDDPDVLHFEENLNSNYELI